MAGWLFRKSKNLLGIRWFVSKARGRDWRVTGSKRIGPFNFNTRGRISFSLFGFTKVLRRGE